MTEGTVIVVVVEFGHWPVHVTGSLVEAPVDSSMATTVPTAVALHARAVSVGSVVVNTPPPTRTHIGLSPFVQAVDDGLAVSTVVAKAVEPVSLLISTLPLGENPVPLAVQVCNGEGLQLTDSALADAEADDVPAAARELTPEETASINTATMYLRMEGLR